MTTKIKIGGFSTLFNVIDFMAFRFRLLLGFSLSLLVTLMIYDLMIYLQIFALMLHVKLNFWLLLVFLILR